jgi:hypothetical protein
MGVVVDFITGKPVSSCEIPDSVDSTTLIESLYQRRHQIEDIVFITTNKINWSPTIGNSCLEDSHRRVLWTLLQDYMISYSFPDLPED